MINDQGVEIERMNGILVNLSEDPRSNLKPGLYDAGESIQNLKLVTSLKKPVGFFDPDNPEGKGIKREDKDDKEEKVRTIEEMSSSLRWPILSFASTDMAFRDNILVAGSYHGFNIYEIQTDGIPNLISSVVCSTDIMRMSPTIETSPCPPGQTTDDIRFGIPSVCISYILKP